MNAFGSNTLRDRCPWLIGPGILILLIAQLMILSDALPALAQAGDLPVRPLPHDCNGFTPPGQADPACCVSGYVHYASAMLVEPYVAAGATVTLTTQAGVVISTTTAPGWLNPDGLAYFKFDLGSAGVQPGEVITLAASYLDKQNHVVYLVSPGGQQVDVVLPEAQGFDAITVIVDDQDTAPSPQLPGFHVVGAANQLSEADCGVGSEFWGGMIHSATSTPGGIGPATITATYRPTLPLSGTYELLAYAPRGCAGNLPQYVVHIATGQVVTTVVDQRSAGQDGGTWVSLGWFYFPAGTDSYVTVNNVTGTPIQALLGLDALKWELRTPFPAIATVTVDDLDTASNVDQVGFYKNDVLWGERSAGCDGLVCDPIFWDGHIYFTYSIVNGPGENSAQWRADLPTDGLYDLYAFVPLCFATARMARYRVLVNDELVDEVMLDQAVQGGVWVYVGSYELDAGTSNTISLDDVTGEDHEELAFDAVRWVLRPRFKPVAVIHTIMPIAPIHGQDIVTLHGSGMDSDGAGRTIVAHEWRSNLDGVLATTATFTIAANALSVGTHVLTFRVQDDEGWWSEPITTHLQVQSPSLEESWHFMLYFAGDNNLSLHLENALSRLQQALPIQGVTVTVFFDRPGAGGTWRYLVQPGGAYVTGISRWYLGEKNTGDPSTLAEYILWARENYPADRYYLAIANHGRGTQGIAWDDTSGSDYMTLPELRVALQQGTDNGQLKIDVLHLDACLMGMVEVGYEVWPYASYMVASENLAWALFGYDRYVQALAPETTPRDLAVRVAEIYHSRLDTFPHTISVLDLRQVNELVGKVDGLARALLGALPGETAALTETLGQVQRFDSRDYGRIDSQDEYIDLRHFAVLLAGATGDATVQAAAQEVLAATALSRAGEVTTTLVHERHASGEYGGTWWGLDHAEGIALYFPPTSNSWDYAAYVSPTLRLGQDTRWDELLMVRLGDLLPPLPPEPGLPPVPELPTLTVTLPITAPGWYDFDPLCAQLHFADNTTGTLKAVTITLISDYPTAQRINRPLPRTYKIEGDGAPLGNGVPLGNGMGFTATLSLCYDESDLAAAGVITESDLQLYRYVGSGNWQPYASTVDIEAHLITAAQVTTFSTWAIGTQAHAPTIITLRRLDTRDSRLLWIVMSMSAVIVCAGGWRMWQVRRR